MKDQEKWISFIHKKAQADPRVNGMFLYGSYLNSSIFNDIDIAFFVSPKLSSTECFNLRLEYLKDIPDYFDITIFNLLPVSVQHEILAGKVIFASDLTYELAYQSIQEFDDFVKYQEEYREAYLDAH